MLGSTVLDVAIGMSLVYLLFSLICSAVSEVIEGFTKNRAADLERGIRELLSHQQGDTATEKLYDHPLIYSLFAGNFQSARNKKWWHKGFDLPSYIPARSFSLALMDLALPGSSTNLSGAAFTTTPADAPFVVSAMELRAGIAANTLLNDKTKRALLTLVDAAGHDVTKVRENVEGWYNSAMDRVSGWYKRRTQTIIAAIALTAAIAVNVDTITIVNSLSTEKSLRDSLVSTAQEYAKAGESQAHRAESNLGQLKALGLPVGWSQEPFEKNNRGIPSDLGTWLLKLVGWMVTAFAACLGAPFWFDTLNKFIVVRSTVKPHEKSQEEASKS